QKFLSLAACQHPPRTVSHRLAKLTGLHCGSQDVRSGGHATWDEQRDSVELVCRGRTLTSDVDTIAVLDEVVWYMTFELHSSIRIQRSYDLMSQLVYVIMVERRPRKHRDLGHVINAAKERVCRDVD